METKFPKSKWLILIIFGLVGQIAWSVENMCFNLFVFDTVAKDLDAITLMVQLSGVCATVVTLIAGTLSDRSGNRRSFISWGYIIWGVTVALFGLISPELMGNIFGVSAEDGVKIALASVIVGDCIMTLFGSAANDAAFNAWVTDNTSASYRGTVEGVLSILPLIAMLIVAGGSALLVGLIGYKILFLALGIIMLIAGIFGLFKLRDSDGLVKKGSMKDIFYGFRPSVISNNKSFYLSLVLILVYGIACQIFMPYMIIYMKTYLGFSDLEYSVVFGLAIILGALVNLYLTRLSDKKDKTLLLYAAAGIFAFGLFAMYLAKDIGKIANLILFGISGFVMIVGYIFISALTGSVLRDSTPEGEVGKLQGVRMVFSVLIPMIVGPLVGNAINKTRNILIEEGNADAITTRYMPAPEIFLAGAICALLLFAVIPLLRKTVKK